MRINIENILNSPEHLFKEILIKLTQQNIENAKKELSIKNREIDTVLFDAIKLVLSDLRNEESYISRLLYRLFKIEFTRNIRREQLIILGSQLKSQDIELKKDIYRIKLYIHNISLTLKNLKRLDKAFREKNTSIFEQDMLNKSRYYLDRINHKYRELDKYKDRLEDKLNIVEAVEKKYRTLLKRIPRYYELNEQIYLQLAKD